MAKREGIWFLVEFDGHRGALCKSKAKELNPQTRNDILGSKGKLEVASLFDFFSPLRPVPITDPKTGQVMIDPRTGQPAMGVGRESIVTGNHFLIEPCPAYVDMGAATKVVFLDDMKEFDRKRYEEWINQAETNLDIQRKALSPLSFLEDPKDLNVPVGPGGLDLSKLRG